MLCILRIGFASVGNPNCGLPTRVFTLAYVTVFRTFVASSRQSRLSRSPNANVRAIPAGHYLNPAAYTTPAAGQWGDAGRNSIEGPGQFSLSAGIARTFAFGERLNLDWRLDASNVLNTVTYASVNTLVGSPQFGLPTLANPLRKIQSTLRLRF